MSEGMSEGHWDWQQSRCLIVVSSSQRLGEEWIEPILGAWSGPIKRHRDPAQLAELCLGLDTPSLFEEPALVLVHASENYLSKQRDRLIPMLGMPSSGGVMLVVCEKLMARDVLAKAAQKAGAIERVEIPQRANDVRNWLVGRLHQLPDGVEHAGAVAEELIRHRGDQVDALLASLDQSLDYAEGPLRVEDVQAVVGGSSERPAWDLTGALFDGNLRRAIELLYAGRGIDAEPLLATLANELRRFLCSFASDDDREAAGLAGVSNPNQMRFARRKAQRLRLRACERLLRGVMQTQRAIRHGDDPEMAVELLMLNAQRVIRPS